MDDVLVELQLFISRSLELESKNNPRTRLINRPVSAFKDIFRSLGFNDYPTKSRHVDLSIEPHPHYASLGALDNFTDSLLIWAYDRQCECDPRNKPYYLDCIASIASGRESSDLQTRVVMATSAGEYGLKEIEEAYEYFTLNAHSITTDDHIIGLYKSRIESSPRQKDEARKCLLKIAWERDSHNIEAVANDKTMSHYEALEYLQLTEDIASDMVIAIAEATVSLRHTLELVAFHCLKLLTRSR